MIEERFPKISKKDVLNKPKSIFIAAALTKNEAFKTLRLLKPVLNSKSKKLRQNIFLKVKNLKGGQNIQVGKN